MYASCVSYRHNNKIDDYHQLINVYPTAETWSLMLGCHVFGVLNVPSLSRFVLTAMTRDLKIRI